MKKNKLVFLAGLAAFETYRFYKGKGIFNKLRFKKQHEAVADYLKTHYPYAFYSDITETEEGWSCVINDKQKKIILYFSETPDKRYVFWEKEI